MTKLDNCFVIEESSVLDFQTVSDLFKSGFSRIPVFRDTKDNIIGLLLIKDITFVDTEDSVPLVNILRFFNHPLIYVTHNTTLDQLLKEFKKGIGHLAVVVMSSNSTTNRDYRAIGVVTLEDIIEEIIQSEILDEKDREKYISEKKKIRLTTSIQGSSYLLSDQGSNSILTENMVSTICKFLSTCNYIFKQLLLHLIIKIYLLIF